MYGNPDHGRTVNCVINGTDFDKTCSFLLQSWEVGLMCRLEVDIFLDYLENASDEGAASAFSKESFMKEVSSKMKSRKSVQETRETYIDAFESVTSTLDGLCDEFVQFCSTFCRESDNFRFLHQYIHKDCMAYISLYLAGRSGNWELRNYALKSMMPMFHVVNSDFYYKLLPYLYFNKEYYKLIYTLLSDKVHRIQFVYIL